MRLTRVGGGLSLTSRFTPGKPGTELGAQPTQIAIPAPTNVLQDPIPHLAATGPALSVMAPSAPRVTPLLGMRGKVGNPWPR